MTSQQVIKLEAFKLARNWTSQLFLEHLVDMKCHWHLLTLGMEKGN